MALRPRAIASLATSAVDSDKLGLQSRSEALGTLAES